MQHGRKEIVTRFPAELLLICTYAANMLADIRDQYHRFKLMGSSRLTE